MVDLLRIVGNLQSIPNLITDRSATINRFSSFKICTWRAKLAVIGVSCVRLTKLLISCKLFWLRWLFFRGFKYKLGFRLRVCQRSEVFFQCIDCVWSMTFDLLGGIGPVWQIEFGV